MSVRDVNKIILFDNLIWLLFIGMNHTIIIIFSLLTAGAQAFLMNHTLGEQAQCDWLVLTTANAAETNELTYLRKHGGARDNIWSPFRRPSNVASLPRSHAKRTN
jgi:hypothetical protein